MLRFRVPLALFGATLLAALVFGLDPDLDLWAGALFYRGSGVFAGVSPTGEIVRRVFYWLPTALILILLCLYGLRRLGRYRRWAPTGRGILFVLLTFAIGPGLIANVILKNHSHRPRPYQTRDFGGGEPFRPFYTFDGACARNCSFVSGEGATSAWTVAPALLVPPPWQALAILGTLVFAGCSGLLRMAFGGHYLSDTIFAALFSWIVIYLAWIGIRPLRRSRSD